MFRTVGDQCSLWESVLPEELLRLPEELARVDALLDDAAFFGPFVAFFDPRMGRPSTPMETYLRLMFLKFRYRLGYESLCREVTDSITWRRFWALVTFPWVVLGHLAGNSVAGRTVWTAPPTGALLTRQGRFASLCDGLRPPLTREPLCALWAAERAGQRPAPRIRAAQTEGVEWARIRPTETSVDPDFAGFYWMVRCRIRPR